MSNSKNKVKLIRIANILQFFSYMHIDKNQEVVYNIIVKKRGGNMAKGLDYSKVATQVSKAFSLASLYGAILENVDERVEGKLISDKQKEAIKKIKSINLEIGKNVIMLDAYYTANPPSNPAELAQLEKIAEGIRHGFADANCEFKGPKDGKTYSFKGQLADGTKVSLSALAKYISNAKVPLDDRLSFLDSYRLRLDAIFEKLYGKSRVWAAIQDYEGKIKLLSPVDTRLSEGLSGDFTKKTEDYAALVAKFQQIVTLGTPLSDKLKTEIDSALNDLDSSIERLGDLYEYNVRLEEIRENLYGAGTISSSGYSGIIKDYEGKWAHFPSAEQEYALKRMKGLFTQLANNYDTLAKEFESIVKSGKPLSDEFMAGVNFTADGKISAVAPTIPQKAEIQLTKRKKETINATIKELEELLVTAEYIHNQRSTIRKGANTRLGSGLIKGGIAVLLIGAVLGSVIAGVLSYVNSNEPTPEQDVPDSNQSQTIETVESYQQEVAAKIAELEEASANWPQEYQDMLEKYLDEEDTINTYNALLNLPKTSSSEEHLKLAEEYAGEIMDNLNGIEYLVKQINKILEEPTVLQKNELSEDTIGVINQFKSSSYRGDLNRVEINFEQNGNAIIRIYFDSTSGSYMVDIGANNAIDFIKDGEEELDEGTLSTILKEGSLSTAIYVDYVDQVDSFSIDDKTVTAFYIDQGDISNLINNAGKNTEINLTIETVNGRYEEDVSIGHNGDINNQESALSAIRQAALQKLRKGHTIGEISTLDSEK